MSSSIDYVKLFFPTSTSSGSAPEQDPNKLIDKWCNHIEPAFGALIGNIKGKIADIRSRKGVTVDLSLLQTIEENAEFLHDQLCKIDCHAESDFNVNYFWSEFSSNLSSYGSFDGETVCIKINNLKMMLDNFEKKLNLSNPSIELKIENAEVEKEKAEVEKEKGNSRNGIEIKRVVKKGIITTKKITAKQFSELKENFTIKNFRVTVKGLNGDRWPLLKPLN